MTRARLWGAILATVLLAGAVLLGQWPARPVQAAEGKAGVQLLIDGRVVGSFQEVSGLGMEVEAVEAVCTSDGRDDDCDGVTTEMWQSDVLTALWQLGAAAEELEKNAWASSRARHDIAMNAIRNIKARVASTESALQDPTQTLKTRHDTVKNSIGNIRALVRVINTTTANEEGVDPAQVKAMQTASATLNGLAERSVVRKRPGRTTYSNITLRGPVGSLTDWSLMSRTDRKSGSIIYLDRDGKEVARYNLFECWPVSFSSTHIVEEIEFVVERVERAK